MKRVVSVFFCLIFGIACLMLRLFVLARDPAVRSGNPNASLTMEAASARGTIYDCEGRPFVNETIRTYAAVSPAETALPVLRGITTQAAFDEAKERLTQGLPAVVPTLRAADADGVRTLRCPVRYGTPLLIAHLAGYCDADGVGICGLEKSFEPLLRRRVCTVTFPVNASGRVLCGADVRVRDEGVCTQRGVVLTIDRSMQAVVRDALLRSDMRKGAAVLLDAQTGDVKAMVSVPEWDVLHLEESLDDPDAPFVNRALSAVSVGSVYKILVAAAALESGISPDLTYTCTGAVQRDDVVFHCHNRAGHGTLRMADALLHSCNPYFIHLASCVPTRTLLELSAAAGLGSAAELAEGIASDAGVLPDEAELVSSAARANLAFGQGRLTASPLQIAAATAAFASDGIYHAPRLVLAVQDDAGARTYTEADAGTRIVTGRTARQVREMLVYSAAHTKQFTSFSDCGGKTATAQTGVYENGKEKLNAWYSGFFPARQPRYVLTILYEDGDSGAADCIPLFEIIAENNEKTSGKQLQKGKN